MARAVLYTGDIYPMLPATVTDSTGAVKDLTGFTSVVFALRVAFDTVNVFEKPGTIVAPASAGGVSYTLAAGDLNVVPGVYAGQWTLIDASGGAQHVDAGEFEVKEGF